MGKKSYPLEVNTSDWNGLWSDGHHDPAAFVREVLVEYGIVVDPKDVTHRYNRFIPIRGEPKEDTWADFGYTYDENRHGYWFDSGKGPGARPYTFADDSMCKRLAREEWDAVRLAHDNAAPVEV